MNKLKNKRILGRERAARKGKWSINADLVFLLYGDNSDKENSDVRRRLKEVPKDQENIVYNKLRVRGHNMDVL